MVNQEFKEISFKVELTKQQIGNSISSLFEKHLLQLEQIFYSISPHLSAIQEIVCYGLGQLSISKYARLQLCFLQYLSERLNEQGKISVLFYDPQMNELEKSVLLDLGFLSIDYNEKGMRTIDKPTLFYMPHCPLGLYDNLIYANLASPEYLSNLYILGNQLSQYFDYYPKKAEKKAPYLSLVHNYIKEIKLKDELEHSLSDCCFMYFQIDHLIYKNLNLEVEKEKEPDPEVF